jgi:prophage regulatory protein
MSILRLDKVLQETGYRSHASIYTAMKAGLFTNQIFIGVRSVGWPDYEVAAINRARIAGLSDDAIKKLVVRLHTKRISNYQEVI